MDSKCPISDRDETTYAPQSRDEFEKVDGDDVKNDDVASDDELAEADQIEIGKFMRPNFKMIQLNL